MQQFSAAPSAQAVQPALRMFRRTLKNNKNRTEKNTSTHTNTNNFFQPAPRQNTEVRLVNGCSFEVVQCRKVQKSHLLQPVWLNEASFVYASGPNLYRYNTRTQQNKTLQKSPFNKTIVAFGIDQGISHNLPSVYYLTYEAQKRSYEFVLRSLSAVDPEIYEMELEFLKGVSKIHTVSYVSSISPPQKIIIVYQSSSIQMAVLHLNKQQEKNTADVPGPQIKILQPYSPNVKQIRVTHGYTTDSFLYLYDYKVKEYFVRSFEINPTPILTVDEPIFDMVRVGLSRLVVLTEKSLFIHEDGLRKESVFSILYTNLPKWPQHLGQRGMSGSISAKYAIVALRQGFFVIQVCDSETSKPATIWIPHAQPYLEVSMLVLSSSCQSCLLFGKMLGDSSEQPVFIHSLDVYLTQNYSKNIVKQSIFFGQKLPVINLNCCKTKEYIFTLNRQHVQWGPWRYPLFDGSVSMDIDPYGLRLIVAFEFCFRLFEVRHNTLSMVFSESILNPIKVQFNGRRNTFLCILRNHLKVYQNTTMAHIYEYESPKHIEFIGSSLHPNGSQLAILTSASNVKFFNLINFTVTRELRCDSFAELFCYDFHNQIIVQADKNLVYVRGFFKENFDFAYSANISALLVMPELNVILVGTHDGSLRCHLWPASNCSIFDQFVAVRIFSSPVKLLTVSPDKTWLYCADEQGNYAKIRLSFYEDGTVLTDEVLITKLRMKNDAFYLYYMNKYAQQSRQSVRSLENELATLRIKKESLDVLFDQELKEAKRQGQSMLSDTSTDLNDKLFNSNSKQKKELKNCQKKMELLLNHASSLKTELPPVEMDDSYYLKLIEDNKRLSDRLAELTANYSHQIRLTELALRADLESKQRHHVKQLRSAETRLICKIKQQGVVEDEEQHEAQRLFNRGDPHDQVESLQKEIRYIYYVNDRLRAKNVNLKEQNTKYEIRQLDFEELKSQLAETIDKMHQQSREHEQSKVKLQEELDMLQKKMRYVQQLDNEIYKKNYSNGTKVQNLVYEVLTLRDKEIRALEEKEAKIDQTSTQMLKFLEQEGLLKAKYCRTLEHSSQTKEALRKRLVAKNQELKKSEYRMRQFQAMVEAKKDSLVHTMPFRIRCRARQEEQEGKSESVDFSDLCQIQRKTHIGQNKKKMYIKLSDLRIKNKMHENEKLISELNVLAEQGHIRARLVRGLKIQKNKVEEDIRNLSGGTSMENRRGEQTQSQTFLQSGMIREPKLTPFKSYQLNKEVEKRIRLEKFTKSANTSTHYEDGQMLLSKSFSRQGSRIL